MDEQRQDDQLCANTGFSLEELPGWMDDRHVGRERVREIRAGSTTWWWILIGNHFINVDFEYMANIQLMLATQNSYSGDDRYVSVNEAQEYFYKRFNQRIFGSEECSYRTIYFLPPLNVEYLCIFMYMLRSQIATLPFSNMGENYYTELYRFSKRKWTILLEASVKRAHFTNSTKRRFVVVRNLYKKNCESRTCSPLLSCITELLVFFSTFLFLV